MLANRHGMMFHTNRWGTLACAVLLGALTALVTAALADSNTASAPHDTASDTPDTPDSEDVTLLAAGSQQDLWVVVADGKAERFELLHRTPSAAPLTLHSVNESPGVPIAIAAAGNTLYMLFDDHTAQAIRFKWLDDLDRPSYSVSQLPPLPPELEPVDLAANAVGPVAATRETDDAGETLLRVVPLAQGAWAPLDGHIAPPPRFAQVAVSPSADDRAMLIGERDDQLVIFRPALEPNDERSPTRSLPLPPEPIFDALHAAGRPIVVTHDDATHDVKLALLQPDGQMLDAGALPLVVSPRRRFAVAGRGHEAIAISRNVEGELWLSARDLNQPADAAVKLQPLTVAPWPGASFANDLLAWGLMLVGIVLVIAVWRRNPAVQTINLPESTRPAPMSMRFVAATIDAVIPVAVSMALFDITDPAELYRRWPGMAQDWSTVMPGVVVIALYAAITGVSELLTQKTLGKAITRTRVADAEGQPASTKALLTRGAVRVVELVLPAFLLFMVISPVNQRLGDLFAQTIVVTDRPAGRKPDHEGNARPSPPKNRDES